MIHGLYLPCVMAANIPKFASFRPKPKATPEPAQEPVETEKPPPTISKGRSHGHHKSSASPTRFHEVTLITDPKSYFSDRRGDADVLRYGSINRSQVPAYHRYGKGYVLGLSSHHRIDRESSTDTGIQVIPATRRRQVRLLTDKRANKSSDRVIRLLPNADVAKDSEKDFIPVSKAKSISSRTKDTEDKDASPDYRNITTDTTTTQPVDPDTYLESDTEVSIDVEMTRKNAEFVQRTREHPEDVEGWLALIDHQEAMLKLERPSADLTVADKAHLADVRISIYEKALKRVGHEQHGHFKLYKRMLEEARRVWSSSRLISTWDEVLAKYPYSIDLWFMYLDFVQSRFTNFKFEYCRSAFFKCRDTLRTSTDGISPTTNLHLLLRLTYMLSEAGYQELALAIWQALLEIYFLRPDANTNNAESNEFEEFWESEVPRIGEVNARGWRHYDMKDDPPSNPEFLQALDLSLDVFDDFQIRETDAMAKLRYPGRTTDDVGEDDIFHTIFYSDIEPYIKNIPTETTGLLVLEAFFCFLGLPPLPKLCTCEHSWWSDPFLHRRSRTTSQLDENSSHFGQALHKFSNGTIAGFQMTSELLFQQSFVLDHISPEFLQRLLTLITSDGHLDDIVGEYLLAFESRHFPSVVFKSARRLLKTRPTSLRLYNAFALVESRRGNAAKADQIYGMALSMQQGANRLSAPDSLRLLHNWVWDALRQADTAEALRRLVSIYDRDQQHASSAAKPDPSQLARIGTALGDVLEGTLVDQQYETAVLCTSIVALLAYLGDGHDAELYLHAHQNLSTWFKSHRLSESIYAELQAQYIAQFLAYHVTHASVVKPALIRTTLEPFIATFPDNTILLSVYGANEARFALDDRVRSIMNNNAKQNCDRTNLAGWTFAIHYESVRGEISGSTSHSIRALYQRATDSTMAHCAAIWHSYVRFELAQLRAEQAKQHTRKSYRRKKTDATNIVEEEAERRFKETFYRGVQNLPWCKDFIMFAFTDAGDIFDTDEKWRLYRIMQEKELRLYVELAEMET